VASVSKMQRQSAAQLLVQIEGQWIVDFEQAAEFVCASHGRINGLRPADKVNPARAALAREA